MSLVAQVPVVKTGLYWMLKSSISELQIAKIRNAYTYLNPKDDSTFSTFIEIDDKIGVPTGDLYKLEQIIGECTIDDRTIAPLFDNVVNSKGLVLRDYQQTAMDEIECYLGSGGTAFNLAGNCGSGKSYMLAALISRLKVKVLIIAHLTSLIEQIKNEIETATGLTVTVLNSKNTEIGDINVATSQFISKNAAIWKSIKHGVGFIVVDEAETVGALSTLRIIQRSYAKYRMFISATFSRSIDKRTGALLDVAGTKRIELVTNTTLKPTIIQVKCPEVFKAPTNKNLYQRAKGKFYSNPSIDDKVIKITLASLSKNRQVLIGVDIIDVQERLAQKLNALGITTGIMNGVTKAKDRAEILAKYDKGEVKVLLGVAVLNAGLSIPKLSTLIKLAVPSSPEKLEQLVGRTRRDFTEKDGAFVIDLVFDGFKNQLPFYKQKVKEEGWKIYQTSYDKFIQQM